MGCVAPSPIPNPNLGEGKSVTPGVGGRPLVSDDESTFKFFWASHIFFATCTFLQFYNQSVTIPPIEGGGRFEISGEEKACTFGTGRFTSASLIPFPAASVPVPSFPLPFPLFSFDTEWICPDNNDNDLIARESNREPMHSLSSIIPLVHHR